jgi:hypothetical protein
MDIGLIWLDLTRWTFPRTTSSSAGRHTCSPIRFRPWRTSVRTSTTYVVGPVRTPFAPSCSYFFVDSFGGEKSRMGSAFGRRPSVRAVLGRCW